MNVSRLLNAIFRNTWAIEPRNAIAQSSLVAQILENKFPAEIKRESNLSVFAESGQKYSLFDDAPKGSIAIIPIKGTMLKDDTWCSYGMETMGGLLREAADHPNIEGAILDIDSGGGSVDAVAPLVSAIRYSQDNGFPVVAFADLAASAAYWVASEADMIIASNDISAEFGSIGVMVSFADMKPMYEAQGIKFHTVYAPESTHKNLAFENALKGDYQLLQDEVLSPVAKAFQKTVKTNRPDINTSIEGILNGKMFYAKDALKNGMIDKIGTIETAMKEVLKLRTAYKFNKSN
jgi:protease IV